MKSTATVREYRLTTAQGRHIRMATMVTFADGRVVRFLDRMPKGMALRQAQAIVARDGGR